MSYHVANIPKGILGEYSKIDEEYLEWSDAYSQNNKVMELCELADLLGAIEAYTLKKFNINLTDLIQMKMATERAFQSGHRK